MSVNTENLENIKSQKAERKSYINCSILVLSFCHFLFIHFFITQLALWTLLHCSEFCKNMSTFNDHKIFSLKSRKTSDLLDGQCNAILTIDIKIFPHILFYTCSHAGEHVVKTLLRVLRAQLTQEYQQTPKPRGTS